jgi:hypothetical protein
MLSSFVLLYLFLYLPLLRNSIFSTQILFHLAQIQIHCPMESSLGLFFPTVNCCFIIFLGLGVQLILSYIIIFYYS